MTAEQIFQKRTGASNEDTEYYIELADTRVMHYLSLDAGADLSPYMLQIADIAVLYYQRDTSEKNTQGALGYSSESFSEGGVSESHAVMNAKVVKDSFDSSIDEVLATLDQDPGTAGKVVFY